MLRTITVLGLSSLLAVFLLYRANSDIAQNLSPQGCRMSWMSPTYLPLAEFDHTWSPLASRYSLWLYRETGWDSVQVCLFVEVLVFVFINGIYSNQASEAIACLSFSFQGMLDRPNKLVQSLRPRPDNIIRHLTLYRQLSKGGS